METYLGDGVYAKWDGNFIKLYTSNGINVTNEIYLDTETSVAVLKFIQTVYPTLKA